MRDDEKNVKRADPMAALDAMIKAMPDDPDAASVRPAETSQQAIEHKTFARSCGIPRRYARPLDEVDEKWRQRFDAARAILSRHGILCLIGPRGTGKTRMSIELLRELDRKRCRYSTVMEMYLELRGCYRKSSKISEIDVLRDYSTPAMLVLDEIQERGDTEWEDRMLTYVLDKRHRDLLPTILIANLKPDELRDRLGASIGDRLHEGGGILEVTGPSFRRTNNR